MNFGLLSFVFLLTATKSALRILMVKSGNVHGRQDCQHKAAAMLLASTKISRKGFLSTCLEHDRSSAPP
eukprot:6197988-Pleurochrysis_carterae.AAC.1